MKQLFSKVVATFRCYSTNATYSGTKCENSFKSEYNSRREDFATLEKPRIKWTDEQLRVLNAVSAGKSVFLTGSAGTGKTALMQEIIRRLRKFLGESRVYVTASTGIAACALDGLTLHSFAGTGFGDAGFETLLRRVKKDRNAIQRWLDVEALVIDELSMIHADYFDSLEHIARKVRRVNKIWGGIQLIGGGDFFQLPPVREKDNKIQKEFSFEADCWKATFDLEIELTKIFRQSDADFVKLLQGIRTGKCDAADLKLLKKCCNRPEDPSAVQLYPRIEDVNRVNRKHLLSLGKETIVYTACDIGDDHWKKQLKSGIAPDRLELCIGARVMLCKNLDVSSKLVNGATGTVVGFHNDITPWDDDDLFCTNDEDTLLPVVKFDCGLEVDIGQKIWKILHGEKIVARRMQIPLIKAWALSVHKCQGMTLDSLQTDLERAFGYGMVYVALSRAKTLDGIHLTGFNPFNIKAHPKVLQFYQNISSK